jgi:hypothetical protein
MSDKVPKLSPEVETEVRHRIASVRERFQTVTRGIYPESGELTVDQQPQNPSRTKEEAPPLIEKAPEGVSVSPPPEKTNLEPASAVDRELMAKGFDHPCRGTCSGWEQGRQRGQYESDENLKHLLRSVAYLARKGRLDLIQRKLEAGAHLFHSGPEGILR